MQGKAGSREEQKEKVRRRYNRALKAEHADVTMIPANTGKAAEASF